MTSRIDIATKRNVYGWSAIVDFTLGSSGGFTDIEDRKASLLWGQDLILTIEPRRIHSLQAAAGQSGYRLRVEATDTASDAERLGLRLAYAILKVAIGRRWGLGLAWEDAPLPCRVVDRTRSRGFTASGFATVTSHITSDMLVEQLETGFSVYDAVPQRVLLSMELYAASNLETNTRVKLVMMVSALEALAEQSDLSDQIGAVVDQMVALVDEAEIPYEHLKASLKGQVRNLTRESARRAIKRLLSEHDMTSEDIEVVESAYAARSKVVHEGRRVPDLASIVGPLDAVLQKLYADL